jgi:hypothetical protein
LVVKIIGPKAYQRGRSSPEVKNPGARGDGGRDAGRGGGAARLVAPAPGRADEPAAVTPAEGERAAACEVAAICRDVARE